MLLNLVSMILSINTAGCLNNQCNNYILNNEEISNKCRISVEEMGLENLCDNQNVVKDLNGNIFVVQESADGFAIYDSISDETLECVKTSMSPYLFDSVHDNYYFGPMQYYYRIENNFSIGLKTILLLILKKQNACSKILTSNWILLEVVYQTQKATCLLLDLLKSIKQ